MDGGGRLAKRRRDGQILISADELACFAYCPEQWRLQHGLGLPPANRAELNAGTRHHGRKAAAERVAAGSINMGGILVIVALFIFALLWLVWLACSPQIGPSGMR